MTAPQPRPAPRSTSAGPWRRRAKRATAGVAVATALVALASTPVLHAATPPRGHRSAATVVARFDGHSVVETWARHLPDTGGPVGMSSPIPALVRGEHAVVFGDHAGDLWALSLTSGATVPGWPYRAGAPIDSTPSADTGQITVGVGNARQPSVAGGYRSVWAAGARSGRLRWSRTVPLTPNGGRATGVAAGLAYATLQGRTAVVGGSLGQLEEALAATTGRPLKGFPWWQADTQFDTPAIADFGHGDVIVQGGSSTANPHLHPPYYNGGHLRVVSPTGKLVCNHNTNEEVDSSPAVGPFLTGGAVGIVAGTGTFYKGVSDLDAVIAIRADCKVAWEVHLAGSTASSPALVTARPGGLQIAMAAAAGRTGTAYLLDGANGHVLWRTPLAGAVLGGITSADLRGAGTQDLVVATTHGLYILDGRNGAVLAHLAANVGLQNSPLVTDDADGRLGITVAGHDGYNQGVVEHFEVTGTEGSRAAERGGWPMFHLDPQLTGDDLGAG